jgi:putative ABC transport system permease protein
MTRAGVVAVFAVEHALVGLVAGFLGALGGGILAWVVVTRGMELDWTVAAVPFVVAVAGCVVLAVAAGTAASGRALARRPAEVLRGE